MSPILVRPVREQLEHDRIIRLLQAKLKRKHEVAVNVGDEQTAGVKVGPGQMFPDLVLTSQDKGHRLEGLIEVETGESVNHLEAMKNKAFFFGTADYARKERPVGFSVNQGGQTPPAGSADLVNRFVSDLKTLYGYTVPGDPLGEFAKDTNSNKYFVRGDFNVAKGHQLTVRHNYIDAMNDISSASLGTSQTSPYRLPDAYYRYFSTTNSTVGQLNSQLGRGVNELRLTYTRIRDHRGNPVDAAQFPQVTVQLATTPAFFAVAGTEQFSHRNAIDQDIIELNDAYTVLKGTHTLTVGTHNEFLDLSNLFIRDNFGTYFFNSLANFEAGVGQQYDHSFSATSDPVQPAAFKVRQWGFYAGDQWRVRPNVTLTYGARIDAPTYPTKPSANPLAVSTFGFATDVVPNQIQVSPRAGFNWDLKGTGTEQVRGGIGLFTGRPAYVWISNQFGNTGIDFTRIGASNNAANRIPFIADPLNQPTTVSGATAGSFSNEIDMIDPDFKYPTVLRGNLGYDRQMFGGWTGTFDFVWSNTINDIAYSNLNFAAASGVTGIGGRPFFVRQVPSLSDAILLRNTNEGYNWNLAYEMRRAFRNGFYVNGSYSYGRAYSIMIPIHSTNHLLMSGDVEVMGGKTGFISKSGYCLATLLRLPQGNPIAVVVLGARSNNGRFWETRHLFSWLETKASELFKDQSPK